MPNLISFYAKQLLCCFDWMFLMCCYVIAYWFKSKVQKSLLFLSSNNVCLNRLSKHIGICYWSVK